MQKTCLTCQVHFDGRSSSRYCSRACAAKGATTFAISDVASQGGRALRGKTQDAEHVAKRTAAMLATVRSTPRLCAHCGEEFYRSTAAQRYCSGRCAEAVRKSKRYVQEGGHQGRRDRAKLTAEEFEALSEQQGGLCKICGRANGSHKLAVDHDHGTGRIRGLLCHRCNTAIGLLKDDPRLLAAAIDYLNQHKE